MLIELELEKHFNVKSNKFKNVFSSRIALGLEANNNFTCIELSKKKVPFFVISYFGTEQGNIGKIVVPKFKNQLYSNYERIESLTFKSWEQAHSAKITCLLNQIISNEELLFSGSIDNKIKLWKIDIDSINEYNYYSTISSDIGHQGGINSFAFSHTLNCLLSCSLDQSIRIFKINVIESFTKKDFKITLIKVFKDFYRNIDFYKLNNSEEIISCYKQAYKIKIEDSCLANNSNCDISVNTKNNKKSFKNNNFLTNKNKGSFYINNLIIKEDEDVIIFASDSLGSIHVIEYKHYTERTKAVNYVPILSNKSNQNKLIKFNHIKSNLKYDNSNSIKLVKENNNCLDITSYIKKSKTNVFKPLDVANNSTKSNNCELSFKKELVVYNNCASNKSKSKDLIQSKTILKQAFNNKLSICEYSKDNHIKYKVNSKYDCNDKKSQSFFNNTHNSDISLDKSKELFEKKNIFDSNKINNKQIFIEKDKSISIITSKNYKKHKKYNSNSSLNNRFTKSEVEVSKINKQDKSVNLPSIDKKKKKLKYKSKSKNNINKSNKNNNNNDNNNYIRAVNNKKSSISFFSKYSRKCIRLSSALTSPKKHYNIKDNYISSNNILNKYTKILQYSTNPDNKKDVSDNNIIKSNINDKYTKESLNLLNTKSIDEIYDNNKKIHTKNKIDLNNLNTNRNDTQISYNINLIDKNNSILKNNNKNNTNLLIDINAANSNYNNNIKNDKKNFNNIDNIYLSKDKPNKKIKYNKFNYIKAINLHKYEVISICVSNIDNTVYSVSNNKETIGICLMDLKKKLKAKNLFKSEYTKVVYINKHKELITTDDKCNIVFIQIYNNIQTKVKPPGIINVNTTEKINNNSLTTGNYYLNKNLKIIDIKYVYIDTSETKELLHLITCEDYFIYKIKREQRVVNSNYHDKEVICVFSIEPAVENNCKIIEDSL